MSAVREVLALARQYRVTIEARGDRLHLKAPAPPPPEVIEKLREAKPAILRLLARPRPEPERAGWGAADWRRYLEGLIALREADGKRPPAAAEKLAWGELLMAWHKAHGRPPPRVVCAGCDKPLSGGEIMEIWDGARVHDTPDFTCLVGYGRRWRAAATAGLVALGLPRPATVPEDDVA